MAASLLVASPGVTQAGARSAPEIAVSVDRHDITVGDPINYSLKVRYDSSLNMIGPAIGSEIGPFVVLHDTTLADGDFEQGRKFYHRRLKLTVFETGDLWVPSIGGEFVDSLGHTTTWTTDSMNIAVISVLGDIDPDSADLRAIKAQYEAPERTWLYWLIGGLIVVAALVIWWLVRRRKKEIAAQPEPIIPAWEAALKSLDAMRQEIDPSTDGGRLWYFRLSEILRRYFDQRYGWSSIDETTSQLLRRLSNAPFDDRHRERVREFFREADRIRYAKTRATDGRPEIDWEWVREFVDATRQRFEALSEDGNGQQPNTAGDQIRTSEEVRA
ncbi:MAG: hypothetical protein Kow0074_07970 [Candidatus Zixiibacteriota bacterium]